MTCHAQQQQQQSMAALLGPSAENVGEKKESIMHLSSVESKLL